ncbi:hypothetical protein N865_07675 [Intrasporangium oryzae NRRL B-24470]|uniref:Uncharacterized protein n=1 Tax=Intrasporangium oryzae NRRL B-24470 TaxID=1386089 RepID=W9G6E4_9MICO|nr:hypothetical protein [Intrasporangium oryzae]EWT01756.1 hypothetical protein N865_07675 [Intrasporangium oryzae NRRL B-24470]
MNGLTAALAVLVPAGTPILLVGGSGPSGRVEDVAGDRLAPGDQIVLVDGRRLSPPRLRRLARRAGLVVDRELAVLPSLDRSSFVVEDAAPSLAWCWDTFATVPPGRCTGSLLLTAVLRLARHQMVLRWVGYLVAGRVVIARRP